MRPKLCIDHLEVEGAPRALAQLIECFGNTGTVQTNVGSFDLTTSVRHGLLL